MKKQKSTAAEEVVNQTEDVQDQLYTEDAAIGEPAKDVELPTPIFIGCKDNDVIEKIKQTFDDKYELAVMNPEVLSRSYQVWLMGKMSVGEQQRIQKMRADEAKREEALNIAKELHDFYEDGSFRHYELKNYFREYRKRFTDGKHPNANVSNRDVRNIIDMLSVYGFLITTTPDIGYEKREFIITLDDVSSLKIESDYIANLRMEIQQKELLLKGAEKRVAEISKRLSDTTELDEAVGDSAPKTKAKRKSSKKKEAVNENGELQETTEHLNDKDNVSTKRISKSKRNS